MPEVSSRLVQVLRTLISTADNNNTNLFLHFNSPVKKEDIKSDAKNLDLNKIMQNVEGEQFDYESFKNMYDNDPRLKAMIHNFNNVGIEPKTAAQRDDIGDAGKQNDEVEKMAKSATDLGDNLS